MEEALKKRSPPPPQTEAAFERRTRRRSSPVEEEEVEEKIALLKKMVPGAAALGIDALFDETASYILSLQSQIKAMRVISAFLDRLEMDNFTKFGG
ncbi:PREDICTED: transcription factor PAR1-like [Tarenaya hassleriana]|uniref:transcription factor PAR1-like n=1 Tax=Tarenaya hassleriana TaxID=28532 RepID=UPI00053C4154|nr:PREDICTED: transcription factor PAR1-like [Tarenaya hassleriana]